MCIIIDANTYSSVFDKTSSEHEEFRPVLDWLVNGNGKMVFGGTTYKNELKKLSKYIKFINLLKDCGKVIAIQDSDVDIQEAILKTNIKHRDFDDPHIVAIVRVSKCKLICSKDRRAHGFFKDLTLYQSGCGRPKIYSQLSNADLLVNENIAEICLPCEKLAKERRELLDRIRLVK